LSYRPANRIQVRSHVTGSTAFATDYRPQFFFGPTNVTGTLDVEGAVTPGAHARVRFVLDRAIALDRGVRFALREGSRTIGAGLVVSIA
jgi:elongation factor Tu